MLKRRLSGRRATVDRALATDELFLSAISFWKVATLVAKRRLELDTTVAALRDVSIRNGAREQVLDGEIAVLAGELPGAHGDPADRMLVATAIVRGFTLLTAAPYCSHGRCAAFACRTRPIDRDDRSRVGTGTVDERLDDVPRRKPMPA